MPHIISTASGTYFFINAYYHRSGAEFSRSGLLADGMGLGKTLSAISLIMSTIDDCRSCFQKTSELNYFPGGTLIVAPLSSELSNRLPVVHG